MSVEREEDVGLNEMQHIHEARDNYTKDIRNNPQQISKNKLLNQTDKEPRIFLNPNIYREQQCRSKNLLSHFLTTHSKFLKPCENLRRHNVRGNLLATFNDFVQLHNVVLDQNYCHGRKGGENINDVLLQPEEDELYKFDLGFMRMECDERPEYFFERNFSDHLSTLLASLQTKTVKELNAEEKISEGFNVVGNTI